MKPDGVLAPGASTPAPSPALVGLCIARGTRVPVSSAGHRPHAARVRAPTEHALDDLKLLTHIAVQGHPEELLEALNCSARARAVDAVGLDDLLAVELIERKL